MMKSAYALAHSGRARLLTPEHLLLIALLQGRVIVALRKSSLISVSEIRQVMKKLKERIGEMERIPADEEDDETIMSFQYQQMMKMMILQCESSENDVADVPHMMNAMMDLIERLALCARCPAKSSVQSWLPGS